MVVENYNYLDLILILLQSAFCGFLIFILMRIAKQAWVNNIYMFITFLALPTIGSVITKVISGDIALSLGMVGALSIIRFRTPIKNPLELVVYFLLLTVGISNTVNPYFGIILSVAFGIILLIAKFTSNFILSKNISNNVTFENRINLIINSTKEIPDIADSNNLCQISKQEGKLTYILEFTNSKYAHEFLNEILSNNENIEYNLNIK